MVSYENTAKEIKEANPEIAVIPLGSIEQHSSHLPIGTDMYLAEDIARGVAKGLDALLLPAIPISTCYEHKGSLGSMYMSPKTFYTMLQDIILCLRDQGIKKVVIIFGHGGIFVTGPAVRELNALYDDLQVVIANGNTYGKKSFLESKHPEIHAGESETSLMLYLHEELVNQELMMENDCIPDYPQNYLNHVPILKLSKTGAWGEPSLATKKKGEIIYKAEIEAIIENTKKAFEVSPEEAW